jgi:hypothetical protein
MLSLVNPDQVDPNFVERQAIINRIIAAGLNSMVGHTANNMSQSEERKLLDAFVSQSFDKILPCWPALDDRIKFFIFKAHVVEFENYMAEKNKVKSNV